MKTGTLAPAALALALSLSAGAAIAQTAPRAPSLHDRSANPAHGVVRGQRPLTVMGMTGGIEPKDTAYTGSIVSHPVDLRHPR